MLHNVYNWHLTSTFDLEKRVREKYENRDRLFLWKVVCEIWNAKTSLDFDVRRHYTKIRDMGALIIPCCLVHLLPEESQ